MTAMAEARIQSRSVGVPRPAGVGVRCGYEEHYPETNVKTERERFEERWKTLSNLFEEISEADEESAGTSNCSSSSLSLEGRSPYALPVEDRSWYYTPRHQTSFAVHPLVSPKFVRRSFNTPAPLQRGFSEPVIRRKKSPMQLGERRSGGSFEQLTSDFLNLPPIPESVPLRLFSEKKSKFEEDEETDYDDSSECSDFNSSS